MGINLFEINCDLDFPESELVLKLRYDNSGWNSNIPHLVLIIEMV